MTGGWSEKQECLFSCSGCEVEEENEGASCQVHYVSPTV